MGITINKDYLIKGVLFSIVLMIGTIIGAIMKGAGYNWVSILLIAGLINIIGAVLVFRYLKAELFPEKVESAPVAKKIGAKSEPEENSTPKNSTTSDQIEPSE